MPEMTEGRLGRRVRHELRRRVLTVRHVERVTPRMARVTLAGPELEGFVTASFDDHVKLFFPSPGQGEPMMPDFGPNGPVLPEGAPRPIARDYTPRRFDPELGELVIDFALHEAGPATEWAAAAAPGQRIGVGGPRGSFVLPDDLDWYLLAGDETALPAIGRRIEERPPTARVLAVIEVADGTERQALPERPGIEVVWVERGPRPPGQAGRLVAALEALILPRGSGHAWVACEAEVARQLRRVLLERHGLPKERVKAAAYWKRGAAAAHEAVED
ncbi:NADPH-dependent ferric siderophore reductase, contains FAD-binding and SIP domains [Roseomonas rosea]|uniref:NADPH-dependent ferric siderophore reductase, contains FAD-binding and SIP domains n=1 Tax=Muricoccus roseus TaxID=198092 RepID=A0A1M6EUX1_9PROT|nr:siderophore-interacting protein [Roseomonas rosea]SHI89232.1 NADPH-dependent ferric siderophore reductase, contains FAD-binding and SIP domains [Roseomonas rosea]